MSSPGKSTHNFGFVAAVGVDPVHEGALEVFQLNCFIVTEMFQESDRFKRAKT